MKSVVLIDPYAQTVADIDIDSLEFAEMYPVLECDMIEVVSVDPSGHVLFCDEEGLFKPKELLKYFTIGNWPHPICGKGIIGKFVDEEYTEPTLTADEIRPHIIFTGDLYALGVK